MLKVILDSPISLAVISFSSQLPLVMELLDTSLKVTFFRSLVLDSLLARIPLRSVPMENPVILMVRFLQKLGVKLLFNALRSLLGPIRSLD